MKKNIEKTERFIIPKNYFEHNKVKTWLTDNGHILHDGDQLIRIRDNHIMNHSDGYAVLDYLINEFTTHSTGDKNVASAVSCR